VQKPQARKYANGTEVGGKALYREQEAMSLARKLAELGT
jgi:hypothetical protein